MYESLSIARHVVDDLVRAGFGRENISLVAADSERAYSPYVDRAGDSVIREVSDGSEVAEGAGIGALIGGLGGLLVGLGALAIPGIGPVIAAGPIVAAITGAGLGAVTGGMVGALIDLGIPDTQAQLYAEGVRRGYNMVAVHTPESRADQARLIMDRAGLVNLEQHASEWRSGEPVVTPATRPAT
jgi:hypothetical protein